MSWRPGAVPVGVALAVLVLWGATPVFSKLALRGFGPVDVALLRTVLAAVVAGPLLAAARTRPPPDGRGRVLLLVSGITGFVAFPLLYTIGQHRTSAMHAGLILAALPVLTGIYVSLLERRRPRGRWLAGCAVALAGEAALIAFREGSAASASLGGDLLVALSALVVAAGYVAGARLGLRGYGSLPTTLWGVTLAAVLLAPVLAVRSVLDGAPSAGAGPWAAVLALALATSIVGYVGWYWALARGGIRRIGTLQFLQPFSGLALAAAVLGERLTAPLGLAAAVILTGVAVAQRSA